MIQIREATIRDEEPIRQVHLNAFTESERQDVATLAVSLLSENTAPSTLNLVGESEEKIVGYVGLSPVFVASDPDWTGYILAPVGVLPEFQKQHVGTELIENGKQRLTERGVHVLFVYGDPAYYSRFGFSTEAAFAYVPPYELEFPHGWQAVVLNADANREPGQQLSCVDSLSDPRLW